MVTLAEHTLRGLDQEEFKYQCRRNRALANQPIQPKAKTDKKEYFLVAEDDSVTQEIIDLHNRIQETQRRNLADAQGIGERLLKQKNSIKHGYFTLWVDENLPFTRRTAQNYMKLFLYKEELAKHEVATLSDAYYVLRGEATPDEIIDADEGINTSSDPQLIYPTVNIESISLPKRKATGEIRGLDLTEETVKKFEEGFYKDSLGTMLKLVIRLKHPKYQDPNLTGRFVCAAIDYLKPGGKIIFHKPE
jgi:hypothetical protein